ncbi:MAG: preprotein translocase subunit SecG [Clostridium sp.]|nr:preprotein translocase subunit SecG [Clostridium sp.]MCM1398763.1 preprotein translocase subunit SecG [Clostridium sp.]MCM1458605.1 preprotein translocase subunit SecG [Bacteroides sp.]
MKTPLIIVFLVIAVILTIIVMMQEGKEGGLTSSISGSTETYWSRNKGKSKEAVLMKVTIVIGIIFMVLALLLSSKFI